MTLTVDCIARTISGKILSGGKNVRAERISIDTRTLEKGDLFVALKGENFDGDEFVENAFKKGASICIGKSSRVLDLSERQTYIQVENPLHAIQKLAQYHRKRCQFPFYAITGSNGKTTVKEILHNLLESMFKAAKNPGNLNGQIGIPISVLSVEETNEICVLEVGISAPGEMKRLVPIVQPDLAILTNIGPVHIEYFPDEEAILAEKRRLLEALTPQHLALIDGDDERIVNSCAELQCRIQCVGFNAHNDITIRDIRNLKDGSVTFRCLFASDRHEIRLKTQLRGDHNLKNILFAIGAAKQAGVHDEDIAQRIATFEPLAMRQEIIKLPSGITIINDTYNASPLSMNAAIKTLTSINGHKRYCAVLGEMLELGRQSQHYHEQVGHFVQKNGLDLLVTVGDGSHWISDASLDQGMEKNKVLHYRTKGAMQAAIPDIFRSGDIILVKASRKVGLETLIQSFKKFDTKNINKNQSGSEVTNTGDSDKDTQHKPLSSTSRDS